MEMEEPRMELGPTHDSWCATEHRTDGICNCHLMTINQMSINFKFLLRITDAIAAVVAPDKLGSWQQRAKWAHSETVQRMQEQQDTIDILITENASLKAYIRGGENTLVDEMDARIKALIADRDSMLERCKEVVRNSNAGCCECIDNHVAESLVQELDTALKREGNQCYHYTFSEAQRIKEPR